MKYIVTVERTDEIEVEVEAEDMHDAANKAEFEADQMQDRYWTDLNYRVSNVREVE